MNTGEKKWKTFFRTKEPFHPRTKRRNIFFIVVLRQDAFSSTIFAPILISRCSAGVFVHKQAQLSPHNYFDDDELDVFVFFLSFRISKAPFCIFSWKWARKCFRIGMRR